MRVAHTHTHIHRHTLGFKHDTHSFIYSVLDVMRIPGLDRVLHDLILTAIQKVSAHVHTHLYKCAQWYHMSAHACSPSLPLSLSSYPSLTLPLAFMDVSPWMILDEINIHVHFKHIKYKGDGPAHTYTSVPVHTLEYTSPHTQEIVLLMRMIIPAERVMPDYKHERTHIHTTTHTHTRTSIYTLHNGSAWVHTRSLSLSLSHALSLSLSLSLSSSTHMNIHTQIHRRLSCQWVRSYLWKDLCLMSTTSKEGTSPRRRTNTVRIHTFIYSCLPKHMLLHMSWW